MIIKDIVDRRKIGLNLNVGGEWEFLLWAPLAENIEVVVNDVHFFSADKGELGYWSFSSERIKQGDLYFIKINDKMLPDPASLVQPEGVHGHSQAFDLRNFQWEDQGWNGLQEENIFYELHTGTFSEGGNFAGIEKKLDYLKDLGINTIEIMPVAQFPGSRNWGYDGVFPFAVHNSYGGPSALQSLVNACHKKGLAVVLDVVYNHLGPEGNYLNEFGPYFTDEYKTPWGRAVNFDREWSDGVRRYYIENMLMWLRDFHIDGLRLDAVHAIKDFSSNHIIRELREHADLLEKTIPRKCLLIGEIDLNDNRYINTYENGGYGLDKQWCDEFHHSLHSLVTGERNGYYSDFGEPWQMVKALNNAYVYDGIYSGHRKRTFGSSTAGFPGNKFVVFTQNHDHVGNRMLGERMGTIVSPDRLRLVAGAMFISPFNPLIFMGEEYNEANPFLYFTSHSDPTLIGQVSQGRKDEFPDFLNSGEFPEPQSGEVFRSSILSFRIEGESRLLFDYYKLLIRLKKHHPVWMNYDRDAFGASGPDNGCILIRRKAGRHAIKAFLNFGPNELSFSAGSMQHVLINSSHVQWGGNYEKNGIENNMVTIWP